MLDLEGEDGTLIRGGGREKEAVWRRWGLKEDGGRVVRKGCLRPSGRGREMKGRSCRTSCADSVDGDGLISTSRMKRDGRGTGAGQHGRVDEGEETIRLKVNELTEGSKRVEDAVEMTGVVWLAVCLSWTDESTNLRRG